MPRTRRKSAASDRRTATVPYVRGFRPPSREAARKAIGSSDPAFTPHSQCFPPVPSPSCLDDWLAQYREEGQSYDKFLQECPWLSRRRRKCMKQKFVPRGESLAEKYPDGAIFLLPIGGFSEREAPDVSQLADYTRAFFCFPVEVLPAVELTWEGQEVNWTSSQSQTSSSPKRQGRNVLSSSSSVAKRRARITSRVHPPTGSVQLQVNSILLKLKEIIPDNAICLMGLTMADLFVAGMAAGQHRVGVFSFCRYDPTVTFSTEFWHQVFRSAVTLMPDRAREREHTVLQRSCKLLVHETAHLLGLDHCIWYSCCMNGSGHLAEDFRQPIHLCPVDLRKLQTLCGFDVAERYHKLLCFFRKHRMTEEGKWVEQRLQLITTTQ